MKLKAQEKIRFLVTLIFKIKTILCIVSLAMKVAKFGHERALITFNNQMIQVIITCFKVYITAGTVVLVNILHEWILNLYPRFLLV